jgi:chromosome segregation ATPase
MTEPTATIQGLRDRLTGLLADWGSELAAVLKELEEKRTRVAELEGGAAGRADEIEQLKQRIEGQNTLIEALRGDAEEASKLRAEVRNKDLEFERVSSELESKKELVRALRRDTDGADRAKADARGKDREIEELKSKLQRAERQASDAAEQLAGLREAAEGRASEEQAEIDALRAELEARKTVIKSLRSDQERVAALQASLDEKRDVVEQLETSINRHSNTIAELRRSVEMWKRKYQAARGESPTATTSVSLPSLSDTDVRVIEQLDKTGTKSDATIAIDMRRSLLEARRTAAQGTGEK